VSFVALGSLDAARPTAILYTPYPKTWQQGAQKRTCGRGGGGGKSGKQPKRETGGKKLKRKLTMNRTKVQPTAKCSTSRYAKPYKTSVPHLTNSIRYVGQNFL
jgi:hypothetical protein